MSKTTGLVGALGAFGALAYLMTPLSPEQQLASVATAPSSTVAPSQPAKSHPVTVARVSPSAPPAGPALPKDSTTRLVQQIQTELLRLGCYAGAVDGNWSPETQQAMQSLGERVRVLRPVDAPDYIMLALARSQVSHLCAPRGQAAASRQPARVVPMAGPWDTRGERGRTGSGSSSRRLADRAPAASEPTRPARGLASSERPTASQFDDEVMLSRERGDGDQSRMGLGVATVDPLRAGMDPRDPSAPAILRGPAPIAPRTAAQGGFGSGSTLPRRAQRSASEGRPTYRPVAPRADWKRTVFNKMKFDGP
jgi:hypothetical protein